MSFIFFIIVTFVCVVYHPKRNGTQPLVFYYRVVGSHPLCSIFMSLYLATPYTCMISLFYDIESFPHGFPTGIRCSQLSQNGFSNFCQIFEVIRAMFV